MAEYSNVSDEALRVDRFVAIGNGHAELTADAVDYPGCGQTYSCDTLRLDLEVTLA
jgi:hypothetical protein